MNRDELVGHAGALSSQRWARVMNPAPWNPTCSVRNAHVVGARRPGLAAASGAACQALTILADGRDEEQLAEQRFEHGQALAGVGGRYEVAVPGRGQRDEAEEEDVGDRAVTGIAEERRAPAPRR